MSTRFKNFSVRESAPIDPEWTQQRMGYVLSFWGGRAGIPREVGELLEQGVIDRDVFYVDTEYSPMRLMWLGGYAEIDGECAAEINRLPDCQQTTGWSDR